MAVSVLVICALCKAELRPTKGDAYRIVKGRPRCQRCVSIHGVE